MKAPFMELLGIEVVDSADGYARLSMPYKKEFTNPYGRLHGGAIMTLADSAVALAVNSKYGHPFYTTKLEIKFKSSVEEGMIFAEARLVDKKKNFVFGEVKVKSDKGEILAEALATFIVPRTKEGVGENQNA
jgi:acyl-CoA thioesterase